jgi:hypothetical protein
LGEFSGCASDVKKIISKVERCRQGEREDEQEAAFCIQNWIVSAFHPILDEMECALDFRFHVPWAGRRILQWLLLWLSMAVGGLCFPMKLSAQRQVSVQPIDTLRLRVPQDSAAFYDNVDPDVYWEDGRVVWYEYNKRRIWSFFPDGRLDRLAFQSPLHHYSSFNQWFAPKKQRLHFAYVPLKRLPLTKGSAFVCAGLFIQDEAGKLVLNQKLKHRWKFEGRRLEQDSYLNRDPAWVDPKGEIITIPARSVRTDDVWPTQDSVFTFAMLRFRVEWKGDRAKAKFESVATVTVKTHSFVDQLDNSVLNWNYCRDGKGGIYLGHNSDRRIWHVDAEGLIDAEFGTMAPPTNHVPFEIVESLKIRKLYFDRDTLRATMAKISRVMLEHNQYEEFAFDSTNGLLFRMMRLGMPDSSAQQVENQKLHRPFQVQVYDTRDQNRCLGTFPMPSNTSLLGIDDGILLLRQRETTDNLGIKIWRFRVEQE